MNHTLMRAILRVCLCVCGGCFSNLRGAPLRCEALTSPPAVSAEAGHSGVLMSGVPWKWVEVLVFLRSCRIFKGTLKGSGIYDYILYAVNEWEGRAKLSGCTTRFWRILVRCCDRHCSEALREMTRPRPSAFGVPHVTINPFG